MVHLYEFPRARAGPSVLASHWLSAGLRARDVTRQASRPNLPPAENPHLPPEENKPPYITNPEPQTRPIPAYPSAPSPIHPSHGGRYRLFILFTLYKGISLDSGFTRDEGERERVTRERKKDTNIDSKILETGRKREKREGRFLGGHKRGLKQWKGVGEEANEGNKKEERK